MLHCGIILATDVHKRRSRHAGHDRSTLLKRLPKETLVPLVTTDADAVMPFALRRRSLPSGSVMLLSFITADVVAFALASGMACAVGFATGASPALQAYRHLMAAGAAWHGWSTLLVVAMLLGYFGSRGHYTRRIPFWTVLGTLVTGTAAAALCDAAIRRGVYAAPDTTEATGRWLLYLPCLMLGRRLAQAALDACGLWRLKTVVIGNGAAAAAARAAMMSEPKLGYEVVGCVDFERVLGRSAGCSPGDPLLEGLDAEFAVIAIGGECAASAGKVVAALTRRRVPFAVVPIIEGLPVTGVTSHYFLSHDVMLLFCGNNLAQPLARAVKAVFDQVVAALLLLLLAPLFAVLIVLIRADGGPALYSHVRIGANGRRFRCLKFRSMVPDAGSRLSRVLAEDPAAQAEWAATHKLRRDPRVTPIGAVLRNTSLDELPQLLNVLRGDMSLVGPRPIVDAEVPRYGDDISYYYEAKPGMTGLWQVSGRSNTTYEHRVQMDVWYARNWTLWHDIAILMKTFGAVALRQGAV
jgi:undecaprenyl-phosphate galactose phosphotransferase